MHAIILAGGKGSRLAPWHAPKCLMPINGVTILQRLLALMAAKVSGFVVCTGYRAEDVENALAAADWANDVSFSNRGLDAQMGDRLLAARKLTDGGRVLICYGDELADVNLSALLEQHISSKRSMTFAVCPQRVTGGVVTTYDGRAHIDEVHSVPVNIGFVIVEPECWAFLKETDGLSDWINWINRHPTMSVGVYHHLGKRATVNTLADLAYAEEIWK